jgi:hypothetical protein
MWLLGGVGVDFLADALFRHHKSGKFSLQKPLFRGFKEKISRSCFPSCKEQFRAL